MVRDGNRCWDAVIQRDAAADGRFVYAVTTTGIYCRPSCSTPTPLRRNVRIFASASAAEAAGFVPCKRCRPTLASPLAAHVAAVGRACAILGASRRAPPLATVADAVHISRFHFHRIFKQVLGTTPARYVEAARWRRLAEALASECAVTRAIHRAGYDSVSRAYEHAQEGLGMTPAVRHAGGTGTRVWFAVVQDGVGQALVALTRQGVCAIELGDDPETLAAGLRRDLPGAVIARLDASATAWIRATLRRAALPPLAWELPAEVREVALQARLRSLLAPRFARRRRAHGGRQDVQPLARPPVMPVPAPLLADRV